MRRRSILSLVSTGLAAGYQADRRHGPLGTRRNLSRVSGQGPGVVSGCSSLTRKRRI